MPADVQPHRRVELERVAAGGGFGVAEDDPDLHAHLVDEDDAGVRLADGAGELAQRLGHQPRLQPHVRVAHLAFDLGPRHQGRHRVDDQDVDGAAAHQHVGDLERLLAGVGLGDEQLVAVDAELLGIDGVERVLGVDEGRDAVQPLGFGDRVQRQRRLAGGFRAEDFDDPSPRADRRCRGPCRARASSVEMIGTLTIGRLPSFMMEPLPN